MSESILRIGTRTSPLALKQADLLRTALQNAHPNLEIEIVKIKSDADWKKQDGEKPLSEQNGGKGQFAKEIEKALLVGEIDCGVHSLKDMPAFLPQGLQIEHFLPRANPCDAFISDRYTSIKELPEGAKVGTCSPRRKAFILSKRPDLEIVPLRGNVQTRLDKIKAGKAEATFLAMAGLERLGIKSDMIHPLSEQDFLPACGQGIVCIETSMHDSSTKKFMDAITCKNTAYCAYAEREILKILDGSCHTPIGAYAHTEDNTLKLTAIVASLDGQIIYQDSFSDICSSSKDASKIGQCLGNRLKSTLPEGFLS